MEEHGLQERGAQRRPWTAKLLAGKSAASLEKNPSVRETREFIITPQVSLRYNIQFALQVLVTRRQQHADRKMISYYHSPVLTNLLE